MRQGALPQSFSSNLSHFLPREVISVGLLAIVTLAIRIPFQTQILYHWDSVNFALGMQEFNLAMEQPHPPGYILYVGFARLVDLVIKNPPATLVFISMFSSTLAVLMLYFLGKTMFGSLVGWVSAIFLALSPLFWFYSEIALPHTLDALIVILCAFLLFKTMKSDVRFAYPAVIALSIAGGLRQQTLVFLLPLLLFCFRKIGWKKFIISGILGFCLCLTWFIPLMLSTGGLANYLNITQTFAHRFQLTTSVFLGAGFNGILYNSKRLLLYSAYGIATAGLSIPLLIIKPKVLKSLLGEIENMFFFMIWIIPSLLFYTFIHMGQQGLIFIYIPALFIILAWILVAVFQERKRWIFILSMLIAGTNTLIFNVLPEHPFGINGQRFLNADTLRNSDRYFLERFNLIRSKFNPQDTIIFAMNWRHVEYYLPEYHILRYQDRNLLMGEINLDYESQFTLAQLGISGNQDDWYKLIIFDPEMNIYIRTPTEIERIQLKNGDFIPYFMLMANDPFVINQEGFGILH
jgi:4-amino-4-deoxy-L-arabinose transferase-like glycosyltransferase